MPAAVTSGLSWYDLVGAAPENAAYLHAIGISEIAAVIHLLA
jgi:hypothetical protein